MEQLGPPICFYSDYVKGLLQQSSSANQSFPSHKHTTTRLETLDAGAGPAAPFQNKSTSGILNGPGVVSNGHGKANPERIDQIDGLLPPPPRMSMSRPKAKVRLRCPAYYPPGSIYHYEKKRKRISGSNRIVNLFPKDYISDPKRFQRKQQPSHVCRIQQTQNPPYTEKVATWLCTQTQTESECSLDDGARTEKSSHSSSGYRTGTTAEVENANYHQQAIDSNSELDDLVDEYTHFYEQATDSERYEFLKIIESWTEESRNNEMRQEEDCYY